MNVIFIKHNMHRKNLECPYCGMMIMLRYAITEGDYWRLKWMYSDHIKDHQDENQKVEENKN